MKAENKLHRPWFQEPKYEISVLLPTRGRREALKSSIMSLIDQAADASTIEILLAVDDDDRDTQEWCRANIYPEIEDKGVDTLVLEFKPLGYARLHEYLNLLAKYAQGRWLLFWNDDAQMLSRSWDQRITEHNGKFLCLRMPTHNNHPYAIFPIVPREWYYLFNRLSAHSLNDAYISQVSYTVGIMRNIDVDVVHDRFDLTGNNKDDTFKQRVVLEGNHNDPRDFNYETCRRQRLEDANKIAWYLRCTGQDTSWFARVIAGEQDPWEYMLSQEQDPNKQVRIYK
jgi:glycosyltransferase involved in cell wall biosynthesis